MVCFWGATTLVGALALFSHLSTVPLPKSFQKIGCTCHLFPAGTMTDTVWKGDEESSGSGLEGHPVKSLVGWRGLRGMMARQGW